MPGKLAYIKVPSPTFFTTYHLRKEPSSASKKVHSSFRALSRYLPSTQQEALDQKCIRVRASTLPYLEDIVIGRALRCLYHLIRLQGLCA